MKNTILEVSELQNQSIDQQLKLIDGKFSRSEALSIINDVVDVKINFHKLQRLAITEGNMNDTCSFDNSRITELIDGKADIKSFLLSLKPNGCNIKISSTINITVE